METENKEAIVENVTISTIEKKEYFDLTFTIDNELRNYKLLSITVSKFPQTEMRYSNLYVPNRKEIITFRADLPKGYNTVTQLWENTNFIGLKGVLTIQKD